MQEVLFTYTHNPFLDNGIIGMYRYLKRAANPDLLYTREQPEIFRSFALRENEHFKLEKGHLVLRHERLFELLEELYYLMGRAVYDTYTHKQEQEGGNLYFDKEGNLLGRFPKMNTYGLTALLTNNAQGTTRREENTQKIADIETGNPELALKIRQSFETTNVKLLSKIYFDEWYTKITRLEPPQKAHFEPGQHNCYLTGEPVKRLVDAQNISPFLSGLISFNSHLSVSDRKVSWKALYLSRFAAATCLYVYPNKLRDSLNVYFLHASDLNGLNRLYEERISDITKPPDVLKQDEFISNFSVSRNLGKSFDYIGVQENAFAILYSIRERVLKSADHPVTDIDDDFGPELPEALNLPVTMYAIRAEAFASTMRPTRFEQLHNFRYAIWLIGHLQKNGVSIPQVLGSLKLLKPSMAQNQNRYALERQLREQVIGKMLRRQSILPEIESFFSDCYGYLLDALNDPSKSIGFKQYKQVLNLTQTYESTTNRNIMENAELQLKAIKLGAQIGQGILSYSPGEKKELARPERQTNARQGRKYIVSLRKANQFDRFMGELSRVQSRFSLTYSRELLEGINEENYSWAKQFIIISALNQINIELNPKSPTNNPDAAK